MDKVLTDLIAQAQSGDLYALGVIPSRIDTRDAQHVPPTATAPPATYVAPGYRKLPVRSQQGGTCVGNSLATCLDYLEYAATSEETGFNGEEIDAAVVHVQGSGISVRDGLDMLNKVGQSVAGATYYLESYASVDHTNQQAVMAAMSAPRTMVTISIWLLSNFGSGGGQGVNNGTDYAHDIPGENSWAYHEVTLVGYDAQGVTFQNSWDTGWGDGGFARFAWDYVAARVGEMWALTNDADQSKNFIRNYTPPVEAPGRAVRRVGTAAVYIAYDNGLVWIQSLKQAYALGVDMGAVVELPLTDKTWLQPIIGVDAPEQYRVGT